MLAGASDESTAHPPGMHRIPIRQRVSSWALQDSVELNFAACNPKRYSPSDAVTLHLDVKNVPSLMLKVYEINTRTYYTSTKSEVRRRGCFGKSRSRLK